MVPRLIALVAILIPLVVVLIPAAAPWPWLSATVAAVLALPLLALRPHAWTMVLLGVAITILATHLEARSQNLFQVTADLEGADGGGWPLYDLTQSPLPEPTPPYVAVRGFLRNEWVLDEYKVAEGEHPDQNERPGAVLVPMAATHETVVEVRGPLVVARVPAPAPTNPAAQTVRGKIEPLPAELLATFLQAGGAQGIDATARGVIIDTLAVPHRREAWVLLGLTMICAGLGLTCYLFAAHAPHGPTQGRHASRS